MFEEFLGEPRPIYRLTRQDVIDYTDRLLQALPNYTRRFLGLTLPQAINANRKRKEPYPTLMPVTVNDKWLSALKSISNWCVAKNKIPDSPANKVKVEAKKGEGKCQPSRINFTPNDLAKIFPSRSLIAPSLGMKNNGRISCRSFVAPGQVSLAQVEIDSIGHERGVLVMRIEGETKNRKSQGTIPIHKALVDLGFEQHIASLRQSGETCLFPKWYKQGMNACAKVETAATKARIHWQ